MKTKLLAVIICFFCLTACSSGINSDKFFSVKFYEEELIPSTTYFSQNESAAVEFEAAGDFSGIEIVVAKASDSDTLTVALYEYDTDYETTVKSGKKIEHATFRNYNNRDSLLLSFGTVPEGKYLITLSTKSSAGICIGTFETEPTAGNVVFYLNGEIYRDGAFYISVIFNGESSVGNEISE